MRLVIAIVGILIASTSAFAAPCVMDTLDDYINLGAGGCTIGQFTFKNFAFSGDGSGGAIPISASAVTVTPSLDDYDMNIRFSSDGFSVTGSEQVDYALSYIIDPPPIIFRFADDLESLTPVAPGVVEISTDVCATLLPATTCPPGASRMLRVFHDGINPKLSDEVFFPLANFLDVQNRITLAANGASSDFQGFSNTATFVPEPETAIFVVGGLALLAIWRHRSRSPVRTSESRQV
jgi:hypothetical protein